MHTNTRTAASTFLAFAVAALALVSIPAFADSLAESQASSELEFGEMVEVSEVLLDVLVTDNQGNVVVGLGPEDFVIEEEGSEIPIASASFYSNRFKLQDSAKGVQKPGPNEVPADRHFILFFHDSMRDVSPTDTRLLRRQLDAARFSRKWVEEEMLPGDWVAVVSYDLKVKVQQDFTQDPKALLRGIDFAIQGRDPKNWKSRLAEIPTDQPSLLRHLPRDRNEMRDRSTRVYSGMQLIANATRDIVGRKALVLFSSGFGQLDFVGRSAAGTYSRTDPRFYPDLEQSLNDNNVAVYSVDLTPSNVQAAQKDFLTQLSDDTGGEYFGTFNNFLTPLRELADQNNGYYLLSYQAEHTAGTTGYRRVNVRAKNPQFEVRARQGYRYGS